MKIFAGTSGFSHPAWKGHFYPRDLAAAEMLRFYAERLPTVELNNTFYRMPRASVIEAWARQVPGDFRFAVKASRRITHAKRLRDVDDELGFLLGNLRELGRRLGVVLFQLPPNFPRDLDRLEAFLDALPGGTPAAFEFRHPSWHEDPEVAQAIVERGGSVCIADAGETATPAELPGGRFGYLRLRADGYSDADLAAWAERIRAALDGGWEQAFVYFKHEDVGAGPRLAARLMELCARPKVARVGPRRRAREAG